MMTRPRVLALLALLGTVTLSVFVVVFTSSTSSAATVMAAGAGEPKNPTASQARAVIQASTPLRRLQHHHHVPNGAVVRRSDNPVFYKFGNTWYYIDSPTACPKLMAQSKEKLNPSCNETMDLSSDVSAWCPTNGLGGRPFEPFIGHLPAAVFTKVCHVPESQQQETVGGTAVGANATTTTCEEMYVEELAAIFPEDVVTARPPFRAACLQALTKTENLTFHTDRPVVLGIGPGSSGTRSLFYALAMLNMTGQHFGQSFDGCQMVHNATALEDPHIMSRVEVWLDTPVPQKWTSLMHFAPAARYIFTDTNSSKWWKTRTTFRRGHCLKIDTNGSKPDCLVPLSFVPPKAFTFLGLNHVTRAQSNAAFDALRKFVRCRIPPDRLMWLDFGSKERGASEWWDELSRFVGREGPPSAVGGAFPRAGNSAPCVVGRARCDEILKQLCSRQERSRGEGGGAVSLYS